MIARIAFAMAVCPLVAGCTIQRTYDLSDSPPTTSALYGRGAEATGMPKIDGFKNKWLAVDRETLASPMIDRIEHVANLEASWATGSCDPEHAFVIISRDVQPSPGKPDHFDVTVVGKCLHGVACVAPVESWKRDAVVMHAIKDKQSGARNDYLKKCSWVQKAVEKRTRRTFRPFWATKAVGSSAK